MIFVVLLMLEFPFLLLGATTFVLAALLPRTRRFALSAAAWCLVFGAGAIACLAVAGVGVAAAATVMDWLSAHRFQVHDLSRPVGVALPWLRWQGSLWLRPRWRRCISCSSSA